MFLRTGPIREILEVLIISLLLFLAVQAALQNFRVEGSSMQPTLHNDELVLVNKLAYTRIDLGSFDFLLPGKSNGDFLLGGPDRGDVAVFHSPDDPARDFVKRIIGLPGDVVEVRGGVVYVSGEGLTESEYTSAPPAYEVAPVVVPPDHYYVMGDNRNGSRDSHNFGVIPKDSLVGKVLFRWFPLDEIGGVGHRDLVTTEGTKLE